MSKKLEFNWREGDFELRSCPRHLVRINPDDENVTIDFIKWERMNDGKEYCYSIGYFYYDYDESCWELRFCGNRFMEIPPEQASEIWKKLGVAYTVLERWVNQRDE